MVGNGFTSANAIEVSCRSQPCKRERTYTAIVSAAIDVIAEKGLETASIDDLMGAAGMARGTFYNYFQSREALLRAVVVEIQRQLRVQVEERIPPGLEPAGVVACMMYGVVQRCLDQPRLGWALVRISGANDWLTRHEVGEQVFPRADQALLAVLAGRVDFVIGHAYLEGLVNMALRRMLEQQLGRDDVEQVLILTLRGLGAEEAAIQRALGLARDFVRGLGSVSSL